MVRLFCCTICDQRSGTKPGQVHIDGGKVDSFIAAGKIDEVSRYCETDVVNTYRLWLIHELFRAAITPDELRWSERQLVDYVRRQKQANPYLQAAMDLVAAE